MTFVSTRQLLQNFYDGFYKKNTMSSSDIPGVQPEDLFDTVLRFGLYLGAVFQLICIAAVIVVPERLDQSTRDDQSDDEGSDHGSPHTTPRRPYGHHRRKADKKKRR
ncbi:hypothetical protein B566_EDAN009706 [Ephemera danica]|nr:hypothetical protein B566_EDAN009706 [Ephemera danica]